MRRIDVIGGSGFIGTRLVKRLLDRGLTLTIIDKAPSKTFPSLVSIGDVRSVDQLRDCISAFSVIVNLAAEHRDDIQPPSLYDQVNVQGAKNICTVAREKSVDTIIFTSSVAVYGFAPVGTDEFGKIAPFSAYGQSKYEAEEIFRNWQSELPNERTLVIIRPTVVFGEQNRGNVYNLLSQIASGRFVMVGNGKNRKSMAYVENVAAFIEYSLTLSTGVHLYNFVDKPDFAMVELIKKVHCILGRKKRNIFRIPFMLGYMVGVGFDIVSSFTGKRFPVSAIRVKKFCSNSVYNTAVDRTNFIRPVSLDEAIERTVQYEFIDIHNNEEVFSSE